MRASLFWCGLGCALLVPLAMSREARAGGYIISEFDSEMGGRAGAAAALSKSPSTIIYNPANLTQLPGLQARAGFSVLIPRWRYVPTDENDLKSRTINEPAFPPNLSVSYNLGDFGFGPIATGVGFYVPYGASFHWPAHWLGREEVQEISLRVYEVAPTIAYQPSKMFSIGAGLRILPGDVYLRRAVRFGSEAEGDVQLSGSGTAVGVSAGVSIWGFENLSLALTWRSPVILKVKGESDFNFPAPFDTEAQDRSVSTRIKLPQVFRLGAAYEVIPDTLNFSADLEFQQWSAFRQLRLVFQNADGSEEIIASPRDAQDSITFHLGGEYTIFEGLAARAGYVYDERTLPEETLNPAPPDSDRHVVTLGVSYVWDKWLGAHVHFANAFFVTRSTNSAPLTGTYSGGHGGDTVAFIAGLTLSANFDISPIFTAPPPEEPEARPDGTIMVPEEGAPPAPAGGGAEMHDHGDHDHADHDHADHDHAAAGDVPPADPAGEPPPPDEAPATGAPQPEGP